MVVVVGPEHRCVEVGHEHVGRRPGVGRAAPRRSREGALDPPEQALAGGATCSPRSSASGAAAPPRLGDPRRARPRCTARAGRPGPGRSTWGTPRPRRRNTRPGCVPAGMTRSSSPSRVANTTWVPSTAWASPTGRSATRSSPSRTKRSWGRTRRCTNRSPAAAAARADGAPPGQAQGRAGVDAGRDVDAVRAFLDGAALAPARRARRDDDLARARRSGRTGPAVTIWPSRLWRTRRT